MQKRSIENYEILDGTSYKVFNFLLIPGFDYEITDSNGRIRSKLFVNRLTHNSDTSRKNGYKIQHNSKQSSYRS